MLQAIGLAAALLAGAASGGGRVDEVARGKFEVELKPQASADPALGRMSINKRFHGELEASSRGEMLSAGAPQAGSAGYVAMEFVTGTLKGRRGGFALQHSGAMDAGRSSLTVTVALGSGVGELAGLTGAMEIDVAAGHHYVLRYSLPPR